MKRETFKIRIDQLQPTQPYLSQARLDNILRNTDFILRPVGVREINGRYCIIEGHERCYALTSIGKREVEVFQDNSSADPRVIEKCLELTIDSGVACVSDFATRILPANMFRQFWIQRKKEIKEGFTAENSAV